jgi:hypothetical protein
MGYRWRGYEHPELYKMINSGPGPAASDPQTEYWKSLTDELSQIDQDLNGKLADLGSRWEGKAAESAQSGLTPLAAWASDAETGSTVMRISSENQADYISDARARMPAPVEVTTQAPSTWDVMKAGAAALTGNGGPAAAVAAQAADHEAQEAAQSEAEQRAIETMQTYESSSTWNRETLGTFVAPPDVVVSTPAPQGGSASAVIIGSSTRSVRSGEPNGGSGTVKTSQTVTPSGTAGTPTVNGGGGGQFVPPSSGGGGGGGGVFVPPPTVNTPPGTTTPQDVFLPPPGGGPLPPGPGPAPLPPTPGPGPGPYPPSVHNPFPVFGGAGGDQFHNSNNAGDVARKPLPIRGGLPGEAGAFNRGGVPGGPGGPGGVLGGLDAERSASQLGRGGLAGGPGVAGEGGVVRNGPGAAGAAGARGGGGVHGPAGAGGRRAEGEEDEEHYTPDYLLESDDVFGDDRRVAPTVIGE